MESLNSTKPLRQARTELMRSLQKAFRIALASQQPGSLPVDELVARVEEKQSYDRRQFLSHSLKLGLLVGGGSLLSSCRKELDVLPTPDHFGDEGARKSSARIAIVGAGMAGLHCAYLLKKAGYQSRIYEASNRIGGRIFTAQGIMAPGLTTELGGEFIDSGHKDMLKLVKEFGLTLLDTQQASEAALIKDAFFFRGKHYTLAQVVAAFQPFADRIAADINSLPDDLENNSIAAFYDWMSISQYFDYLGMTGWLRSLLEIAYVTEYGLEADQQSSINFLYLFSPDTSNGSFDIFGVSDERYKIKGGSHQVINALYEQVKNQVTTDRKLIAIKEKPGGEYVLTFRKTGGSLVDETCEVLVLTLPFTLLRQVDMQVKLPSWKRNAIQNLGYGTNAKLLIGFHQRQWRKQGYSGYLFSDTPVQTGWDNSQLQPGKAGGYTVYLGGQQGVSVGFGSAHSQLCQYLPSLNRIWPGMAAKYNGQVHRMHWPTYPYTLGSYACYKPGQWTTISGNEIRRVGKMYFAGEHCSLEYQGYMNGAAETGRRAAKHIISGKASHIAAPSEESMLVES
jgi:monoamine oxidase